MEAHTIQRIGAYLLDLIILSLFVSLLTFWIPTSKKYDDAVKEESTLVEKLLDKDNDFNYDEFYEESTKARYTIDKESIITNIIQLVVIIGYFGTFAYYNHGQTFGKKLLKIKIVSSDDSEL